MVVQHNLPAMNSHRQLGVNNAQTAKNLEKLSSGFRVNRAGDDAAGLAISEKMRGQIRGLDMATTNAENGVSLIQTAEGGLNETHAILQRMRELSVQSANGTYADDVDRTNINKEVSALKDEIDRISSSTHYNGIKLLDGSMGGTKMSGDATTAETKAFTDNGFVVANTAVTVTTAGTAIASKDASFLVTRDDTGAVATVSMQVGDKTYNGKSNGSNYDFVDAAGVTVAQMASSGVSTTASTSFPKSATITNVTLSAANAKTAALNTIKGVTVAGDSSKLTFQIGANGSADQQVNLHVSSMSTGNIGSTGTTVQAAATKLGGFKVSDVDVSTRDKANESIKVLDDSINQVSGTRADLGALQNRLEHTINNLGTTKENLQAAESSIRDVDMAKEMMEFTKNNILSQASQSMLSQSNQLPQGVLQLLR